MPVAETETVPPVTLSPARRIPQLRSQAEARAVQALLFGSPVCPEGDRGVGGAQNLSRFGSEPSCGHGSALSGWMGRGRLSRQNFWGIQYSSSKLAVPPPKPAAGFKGSFWAAGIDIIVILMRNTGPHFH